MIITRLARWEHHKKRNRAKGLCNDDGNNMKDKNEDDVNGNGNVVVIVSNAVNS